MSEPPRTHGTLKNAAPPRRGILPYGVYVGILGVYYLSARLLGLHPTLGRGLSAAIGIRLVPILVVFYLFGRAAWIALVQERTLAAAAGRIRSETLSWPTAERLLGIPFFVMGTVYTFDIYASFKQAIPNLTTYGWDLRLAAADAFLHLGKDPWHWSHSLLGDGSLRFLDEIYKSWYAVLVASVPLFATWAPLRIRNRFFLAFSTVLMIGGSFAAVLFASGGPAYFAELAGDPARFAPLLERLQGTQALATQARLWEYFSTDAQNLYGGISAMPSMHVAVVALIAIAGARWNLWMGLVTAGYGLLILLGSFHLGWHYALDGYVSVALVALFWLATRVVTWEDTGPQ